MNRNLKYNYTNDRIERFIIPSFITGKKYYLYAHTRPDTEEPFYFGIGTMDRNKHYYRAASKNGRNPIWKSIVNKTKYTVLIIEESDNKQSILDREIQYIKLMGKKSLGTGCLANLTDGGEGLKGHKVEWTLEMRAAASVRLKNRKIKETTREKLREEIKNRSFYGQSAKYVSKPILQIDPINGSIITEFLNCVEAAKVFNIRPPSIHSAVRKGFTSMGYKWRYKDEELNEQIKETLKQKRNKPRKAWVNPSGMSVQKRDRITGEVVENFQSYRSAGRSVNQAHANIKKAVETNSEAAGYKWTITYGS